MKTILVIEDNEEVRENTAELLCINQYDVITAENGYTGFLKAKEMSPDLILCDMMMPETDGQGFLELAKNDQVVSQIPLVFFSAGTAFSLIQKQLIKASSGFFEETFFGRRPARYHSESIVPVMA